MRARLRFSIPIVAAILLAASTAATPGARAAESMAAPAVVELFTSQGCNSCPPADALLGELAGRADVIALSLHVDYWNYIGWRDPFASPRFTARQRAYMRRLRGRYVYTPQMIVDGNRQVVGSRREEVVDAVRRARMRGKAVTPRFETDADGARVIIPAGTTDEPASVWLALYDRTHRTPVARGENAGRTLVNHNVVRELRRLATWTGERLVIELNPQKALRAGRDGCAVLVQQGDVGPIIGAAAMRLPTVAAN